MSRRLHLRCFKILTSCNNKKTRRALQETHQQIRQAKVTWKFQLPPEPHDGWETLPINVRTRGHTDKIKKNRCRLDLRRHYFSERVVDRSVKLSWTAHYRLGNYQRLQDWSQRHKICIDRLLYGLTVRQGLGHICSGLRSQVRPHPVCTWGVFNSRPVE